MERLVFVRVAHFVVWSEVPARELRPQATTSRRVVTGRGSREIPVRVPSERWVDRAKRFVGRLTSGRG